MAGLSVYKNNVFRPLENGSDVYVLLCIKQINVRIKSAWNIIFRSVFIINPKPSHKTEFFTSYSVSA